MSNETQIMSKTNSAVSGVSTPARTALLTSVINRAKKILIAIIVPVALIGFWSLMVSWTGTRLIPPPSEVVLMMWDFTFGGIYDDAFSASLPIHLWVSLQRVYGGFLLAAVIAVPLGIMLGRFAWLRAMLDPTLALLRPVPVTAWLPLSMIFFGLGPRSAIFLVFLGAFFPILLNTVFGVKSVDEKLFEAASMLGCKGSQLFRSVVLPAATPSIFNGLRLGHGFAWILIVVGEMTGVPEGLGAVIMDGRTLSRTELVITGMIVIGLVGFLSDRLIIMLNNRLLRWSPQHHA
ncbi:ABC transporter permease [Sneathiella litorea]|nr:ABC transporter permease [Sneathiella litorea]